MYIHFPDMINKHASFLKLNNTMYCAMLLNFAT